MEVNLVLFVTFSTEPGAKVTDQEIIRFRDLIKNYVVYVEVKYC